MKSLRTVGVFILLLSLSLPLTVLAAREVEPNNNPEQATLVDPRQPIAGTIQDQADYYKIILAEAGEVRLRLDGYPAGARIQLGISGFQENNSAPRQETRTDGKDTLRLRFEARDRVGLIWLKFDFAETVCQDQWCAARFTPDGPWFTTRSATGQPTEWQGAKVLPAPSYRLRISSSEQMDFPTVGTTKHPTLHGYKQFTDSQTGLSFKYPPQWQVSAEAPGLWRLAAIGDKNGSGMHIDLELRLRRDYPGSSAARQINLAESDLLDHAAEIRKQGRIKVAGTEAPYLVAVIPPPAETTVAEATARLQVVAPLQDHYCWIGYSGPVSAYAGAIGTFETLLQTLSLQPRRPETTD